VSLCLCFFWFFCKIIRDTLRHTLAKFPDATTFEAKTWEEMKVAWDDYVIELHDYEQNDSEPAARSFATPSPPASPSPASSPTDSTASRTSSPSPSLANEACQIAAEARRLAHIDGFMADEARLEDATDKAPMRAQNKITKEELEFLANNQPPPVPLSPQRARQQFDRVLGADAVAAALASIAVGDGAAFPSAVGDGAALPYASDDGDEHRPSGLKSHDGRSASPTPSGARFNGHLQNFQIAALGDAGARFVEREHGVVLVWVDPKSS
jgi:hypothetical protein